jgi:hypothetical protein
VKSDGGITASVVTTSGNKRRFGVSFSGQSEILSSVESLDKPKSAAKQDQSALPAGISIPTVPSPTVPPHLPGMTKSTFRAYSGFDAV